ncbi:hypothetical protein DOY81_002802, partial [Sarcophaga bullata]
MSHKKEKKILNLLKPSYKSVKARVLLLKPIHSFYKNMVNILMPFIFIYCVCAVNQYQLNNFYVIDFNTSSVNA